MTKPDPLVRFRIYPERDSRIYIEACIWRTEGEMYTAINIDDNETGRDFWATVLGLRVHVFGGKKRPLKRDYLKPICARMYFSAHSLGPLVIAHEAVHAALRYLERRKVQLRLNPIEGQIPLDDPEERLAYCVGHISNEIVRRARLAGISAAKVWVPKERKRGGSKGSEGGRRPAGRQASRAALRSVRR